MQTQERTILDSFRSSLRTPTKREFHYKCTQDRLDEVLMTICHSLRMEKKEVCERRRKREKIIARQLFCYISYKVTSATLKQIGDVFGYDHTTVIHSISKFGNLLSVKDKEARAALNALTFYCEDNNKPYLIP